MASAHVKPHGQSSSSEGHKHKTFDREIKDMISTITHRATDLHKQGSFTHHQEEDDDHGVRVITLAGTNTGATFRGELEEKHGHPSKGVSHGEPEGLSTYINSNFQALNNSIMFGESSYTTNDPGVHMDISDFLEHQEHKHEKVSKKGKKKEKEHMENDHSGHSE